MDYRQAVARIKKGYVGSCYLFSGPGDSLKEELLNEILATMKHKGKPLFLEKMDGTHINLEDFLESLRQVNIFSGGRLIWVVDPPYFSSSAKGQSISEQKKGSSRIRNTRSEKVEETLMTLAKEPFKDVMIIFSVPEVDRRKKIIKVMEEKGILIEFPLLKGAALLNWVKKELASQDRKIEEKALARLIDRIGENPGVLKKELEKIATYIYPEKTIAEEVVDKLVPESREGKVFNLMEAVGHKNIEIALKHLHKMYRQGEHPLVILTMIARQYRLLYQTLLLTEKGSSQRHIISFLKLPPFVVKELLAQVKNYDQETLAKAIISIKDTDLAVKKGYRDPEEALEHLIIQFAATT